MGNIPRIALSHLTLDWHAYPAGVDLEHYLTGRGIDVHRDDLGRACIARSDARALLTEQREQQHAAEQQRHEIEARQLAEFERQRAQIWAGIPAGAVPDGLSPAMAMVAAGERADPRPRRRSVLEDALSNDGTILYVPGAGGPL